MSKAIATGMQRSVYSNEAGWGTSPMVHASSKTRHPVEQGLWGSFEVFVDTFIVCTITALSVLITGEWTSGATNATLALNVFQNNLGIFRNCVHDSHHGDLLRDHFRRMVCVL